MEAEELIEDAGMAARCARARNLLPQITQQVKQALDAANIGIDVFVLIPASGDAVAMFGTPSNPDEALWTRIGGIVCSVVQKTVGLEGTRCRELACATTADKPGRLGANADTHTHAAFCGSRGEMRYRDIQPTEVRLPRGYPVLAEVSIAAEDWFRFEQMVGDTPVTKIIGHDDACNDRLVIRVACASTSVADRLRDGWE